MIPPTRLAMAPNRNHACGVTIRFFCSSSMHYLRFRYFPPCNDFAGKGQRKPSVGWRSPGSRGGLKGPTDRDDPQFPQLIKTGHQIFNPVQSLVNGQVTPQGFNPMALARRRGTGFPPVIVDPIGQTVADGVDGGLKCYQLHGYGRREDQCLTFRTFAPSVYVLSSIRSWKNVFPN